ncbi:hypothetical protein DKM44_06505 [Deinococcus irradiatisoli]|uniref:Uncharacterized protein n=1 Tax=Deinococcus irradiatisoli TaxID=2202254 RepID=A0A2Z3JHQ7_9DEIO|nr:DUF883 C-terminal domain-containing protein [Deinococcus irradiatisoli]AWN22920.1 hypothetical protein DKM44_06505 [Deinococcus irradiatisoli]
MNEREDARVRLQEAVDQLGQQASLQVQMQKEPLKMLGIATGVGAVLGLVIGRSLSKTKKIYVDETLSKKDQKAFAKAQARYKGPAGNIGGALTATLVTLAFKVLQDRFITPKLEEMAQNLTQKAEQAGSQPRSPRPSKDVIIRDFRAPSEKAHADERGNLHVTPAQQAAGNVAHAARDVQVRDFRVPAEKAHADQYGNVISEAKPLDAQASITTSTETKPKLEK